MRRRLLVILVLGVLALVLGEVYGPGGRQRRGMRAAAEFRRSIEPALAADPRFADVKTAIVTHPSVRVWGRVPDSKAMKDLEKLVQAPPGALFGVFFQVEVGAATTLPSQHARGG